MNKVETFEAETLPELQDFINDWCKRFNVEPLSVSVGYSTHDLPPAYFAAVVVKEL